MPKLPIPFRITRVVAVDPAPEPDGSYNVLVEVFEDQQHPLRIHPDVIADLYHATRPATP